jgi:hypothetical protein
MNSVSQNSTEKISEISDTSAVSSSKPMELSPVKGKKVIVDFDGGQISSDAGALLLKETEQQVGIIEAIEAAINDRRDQRYVIHPLTEQLQQRIFQIGCGYEDANDSDTLRDDPIFKICAGKEPESAEPLSSQPTISRLENAPSRTELYRIAQAFVDNFIASYSEEPRVIVLDFDDTDDIVHGRQQLALFNGYFKEYCFMPLLIFEGLSGKLISPILKPGKRLPGKTILAILKRLVARLRKSWKNTLIIFRGDSHFAAPEIMEWIDEQENVHFVTGLTGNPVLKKRAETTIQSARNIYRRRQSKVKLYHTFYYKADSWAKPRRVVAKVEVDSENGEPNLRFVVTDLEQAKTSVLYEQVYCARGQDELYIKDLKTYLKSDRTSCHRFQANQLRLFLHSAAYVLLHALRNSAFRGSEWANATMQTIQLKVLKIGARVKQMKTRIKVELPSAFPYQERMRKACAIFEVLRC